MVIPTASVAQSRPAKRPPPGSPVEHSRLDGFSPMNDAEASALAFFLSSLCFPAVSPSSPLTGDNPGPPLLPKRVVCSETPRRPGSPSLVFSILVFYQGPHSGAGPVIAHAWREQERTPGCTPRAGGCSCQSNMGDNVKLLTTKTECAFVAIMAGRDVEMQCIRHSSHTRQGVGIGLSSALK
ncbi:hypothetical protein DPEC_G00049280 [Dallia pectoralis]|uniref:Uncharacterized protein n=1 Tax=Dallia pectoralis TaxID=75939 RepID=A0ACC2HBC8_DALPE|nr:hypothetical protein DPEC_G00049280 [Dallia pectoralis]